LISLAASTAIPKSVAVSSVVDALAEDIAPIPHVADGKSRMISCPVAFVHAHDSPTGIIFGLEKTLTRLADSTIAFVRNGGQDLSGANAH
jgi:hypothetical protein